MKVDMYNVSYNLTHPDKTTTIHRASVSVPGLEPLIHHYLLSHLKEFNAPLEKFNSPEAKVEITEIEQGEPLDPDTCVYPPGSMIKFSPAATVFVIPAD